MRIIWFLAGVLCTALGTLAQSNVLYQTGFERSEGYDPQFTLAFQKDWISEGTGGNGLLVDFLPGMGQQAYIGFHPPTDTNDFTSVWKPLNISPIPAGHKIIRFSVTLHLVRSTAGGDDDFRWSVYSTAGNRLFSLDFETRTQNISYISQDGQFHTTGITFDFDGVYDLVIWMNFERNLWSAHLNNQTIVNSQTMAASTSDLTLGDVDAVWIIRNMAGIGNNAMVFDDYKIVADSRTAIPATLEPVGINNARHFTFRVHGEKGRNVAVDVTTNFRDWFSLGDFQNPNGVFLFEDTTSADERLSFYRVAHTP
jgi:hypothetical protein